nr:transposase [Clostridium sporogenes]
MDLLKLLKLFTYILKVIHQIRNSSKYVSYKDLKEFNTDLKLVYTATTEEAALAELERFEQKWGDKYLILIR